MASPSSLIFGDTFCKHAGGENSGHGAISFCNQAKNVDYKQYCFTELIGSVSFYNDSPSYRKEFCTEVPIEMQSLCLNKLQ
jgi:hypothetical protein